MGVIGVVTELFEDSSDADEGVPYRPIFGKTRMVGDDEEKDLVESWKGEAHEQRFCYAENALVVYQTFYICVYFKVLFYSRILTYLALEPWCSVIRNSSFS